jgi:hypothetical protein
VAPGNRILAGSRPSIGAQPGSRDAPSRTA